MAEIADLSLPYTNQPDVEEDGWRKFLAPIIHDGPIRGVLDELEVFADDSGMQVKVRTGAAHIQGQFGRWDTVRTLPIASNALGGTRHDLVVIRSDFADQMELDVVTGLAIANDPTVTRDTARWEIAIGRVKVPNAAPSIVGAHVIDIRPLQRDLIIETFETSGNFVKANYPGGRQVTFRCQGGGGGGGGAQSVTSQCSPGRGGTGGAYAETTVDFDDLDDITTITVGAGGAGGAGANNGAPGGMTSAGAHCAGAGGFGGFDSASSSSAAAISGHFSQTSGVGDRIVPGEAAQGAIRLSGSEGLSGAGGNAFLGVGGAGVNQLTGNGHDGKGWGGGGGGACSRNNSSKTGGDGAPGVVIVEIYGDLSRPDPEA